MQNPRTQQGLEGREESQLHQVRIYRTSDKSKSVFFPPYCDCNLRMIHCFQARVEGVQHPQDARAPADRPAVRRVRDRPKLLLHGARVLRRPRPRLLPQAAQDHQRARGQVDHHAGRLGVEVPERDQAARHPLRPQTGYVHLLSALFHRLQM